MAADPSEAAEVEKLYQYGERLGEAKDKAQVVGDFEGIIKAVKGQSTKAKQLAAQLIPRFMKFFPALGNGAMDSMFDLLEEEDLAIEGVNTKEEVAWYCGKRLADIYMVKVKKNGSHYRCIWGKIARPHGNSGVVRAKFKSNLPPKAMGRRQNTWSYLSNEMTADFRGLCAEEACLQQELEKLQI